MQPNDLDDEEEEEGMQRNPNACEIAAKKGALNACCLLFASKEKRREKKPIGFQWRGLACSLHAHLRNSFVNPRIAE